MNKNAVKQVKEQVAQAAEAPKQLGLFRRAINWMKNVFKKGAKAVGKIIPDRAKQFVVSSARKVSNALSYAYDYVAAPLSYFLDYAAVGGLLGALLGVVLVMPALGLLLALAFIGGTVLTVLGYAYLRSKEESSVWARRIARAMDYIAYTVWTGLKAATVVFMLVVAGTLHAVIFSGLMVVGTALYNEVDGANKALNKRRAIAEADEILAGPSMPAVATA